MIIIRMALYVESDTSLNPTATKGTKNGRTPGADALGGRPTLLALDGWPEL